ncbi:hypothetical protein WT56_20815 [Burkholderia pseudomultivorans]|uniref:Uncharacterized protein n=2 Tax=Burkholderia pseudomultivorans TaxID=1207504 RepID=A0A132EDL2_9BURK|nr:hypothetical protein WT56_20815 [Burkholderia pseudomultivorans]
MVLCSAGFVMSADRAVRDKKNARCKQRARIPVKEVSHELRAQIKEIARGRQRSDFDIVIACAAMSLHAFTRSDAHTQKKNVPPK